jgi:hypothetical protein
MAMAFLKASSGGEHKAVEKERGAEKDREAVEKNKRWR